MIFKKAVNKGFTLIELILVIAILSVLASVAVPNFIGISNKAKVVADNANIEMLNSVTSCYGIAKTYNSGDIFSSLTTDEDRMQELINDKLLTEPVVLQQDNATPSWDISSQKWVIHIVSDSTSTSTTISSSNSTSNSSSYYISSNSSSITSTTSSSEISTSSNASSESTSSSPIPVTIDVESITLNQTTMTLAATTGGGMNDGPKKLIATIFPKNATNQTVIWTSSNTKIATVDSNGVVSFVKPGVTFVTASTEDGKISATCKVKTQW